jgi:hypothetical protein
VLTVKKLVVVLAVAALLVLPVAARWLYYYDPAAAGRRPAVVRPDLSQIAEPALAPQAFEEEPSAGLPGTVLVDLAHENRVDMAELGVLQARLAARGQRLEPITDAARLGESLRYARSLVVISPGSAWKATEIELVSRFVDKGGRLLLVTDPSRFGVLYDEWGSFSALDHDVVHINDLAARFGLVFQADYLYNTVENEGNYRHIRLTDFAAHPVTEGLERVVLLGTHSIVCQDGVLLWAGGDTRSSSSERAGDLTVAALAAGGQVLGLGDLSFMLEPYNTLYDNDRFIANIADLLAGAERRYGLEDFPFFFQDEVDLVYAGEAPLDRSSLAPVSRLQDLLGDQGLSPAVRVDDDQERDTIILGLFDGADEAEPYLSALGITLTITPTGVAGDEDAPAKGVADEASAPVVDRIQIDGLGEIAARGSLLLAFQEEGDRQVLLVLAGSEASLAGAVERLATGNLAGCVFGQAGGLALCPVDEKDAASDRPQEPEAPAPAPEPQSQQVQPPVPAGDARILVISLDSGEGRYDSMTGVDDYVRILEDRYAVSTWSTAEQGLPGSPMCGTMTWSSGRRATLRTRLAKPRVACSLP